MKMKFLAVKNFGPAITTQRQRTLPHRPDPLPETDEVDCDSNSVSAQFTESNSR